MASHALTTLAAVKQELELGADQTDNAYLTTLIGQASSAIEASCCRSFARQTYREIVRHCGGSGALILGRWPIVSVASVTRGGGTIDPAGYEIDRGAGMLIRIASNGNVMPWSDGATTVEYVAGYVLPDDDDDGNRDLPEDVERAAVLLVRNAYLGRGRDPAIRSEDVEGVSSVTFGLAPSLSPEIADMLARYRVPSVG